MEDYKLLIQAIGFFPKENTSDVFEKFYDNNYSIEIDFEKKTFYFGGKIKIQGKDFQNVTKPEDWVVIECVNRLLEKGYKPENISLEKVYPAGHGYSGRLDICVNRDDGSEYLLIECKTYGKEFEKEYTRINKDGGQLFTYFKFSNKADLVMLYTSKWTGKDVTYKNQIIKIEEDYRQGDVKDFFEKWNKLTKDNGVFDSWVFPYDFESKALTISDLCEIKQEDSSFIFNRFLEILRHNVVSDKGNAFNRIFTLFLCKIYDEKTNEGTDNELGFQWLEGVDNHRSFQLRLTDLYKNGMNEFLEKVVTDFSETEFKNKFPSLTEEQRNPIIEEFRKIRLEKNNEFAIKDVYDEHSFNENAIVVKEIVQLLEKFKLRYTKKQQYLSDFFELLLTTGLKQESGQFFTPVPVAQFVIKSLPIDTILEHKLATAKIDNDTLLPYVIDYAAGSGHFLTETMHEIQRLIDKKDDKKYHPSVAKKIRNWKDDHFAWAMQYVYGIEKDYRLVKVGKVGCYLHGDGLANVIHSDGLSRFNHPDYKGKLLHKDKDFPQDNKQFDIIVSNPPYSIESFKNVSRKYYSEDDFNLFNSMSDNSSEIECLFIERTKQLLKDGGIAGVILPISIKSDKKNSVKEARKILLNYFEIVALCELGKNTFLATSQETTIYFLRRKNNYESSNLQFATSRFFVDFRDITINGIENTATKYVNHVWESISLEDYISLLKKTPNITIKEHKNYKEYQKNLNAKSEKEYFELLLSKENEKFHYFVIAYPQKVVLVKSGEKDAEKKFLGYKFSERRSQEGIKSIHKSKNIEETTMLFNEVDDSDDSKASFYIKEAFNGNFDLEINPELENYLSYHKLEDFLTFNNATFDLTINTSEFKSFIFDTKYDSEYLENILEKIDGNLTKIEKVAILQEGNTPVITQEKESLITGYSNDKNVITDLPVIVFGDHSCCFKYIDFSFLRGADGTVLLKSNSKVNTKYLYYFLKIIIRPNIENLGKYERHFKYLKRKKIPIPPTNIQAKLVYDIEILEEKSKTFVVNDLEMQIEDIIKKYLQ